MSVAESSTVTSDSSVNVKLTPKITSRQKLGLQTMIFGLFLCSMLGMISGAGYIGARTGITERQIADDAEEIRNRDSYVFNRFDKGLVAYNNDNFGLAISNFEEVLKFQPTNKSAQELIVTSQAMQTRVALPSPTPNPTLPPDRTAGLQILQNLVTRKEWDTVIISGEQLRAQSKSLSTNELNNVEDALFKAYSARGLARLQKGELESGLFDLDMAAQIKPLDQGVDLERKVAGLYQSALYVYGADWEKSVERFRQVYMISPRYRDVVQRLNESYKRWGDLSSDAQDWCNAEKRYASALQLLPNPEVEQKRYNAQLLCPNLAQATIAPTIGGTPVPGGVNIGGSLYYSIGGVWYRTDGTANAKSVNPFGSGNNSATYSPDRQRMAYTNGGTIYIAQTKNSSLATPLIQGNYPSWGPTGQIIFQGCFNGQCGLHVINPDNPGQVTRLSSSSADIAPRWSPFGGEIVYMSNHSGAWEIYSVTIGGQFRQLTGFRASSGLPVWSPDGGRVAFVSNRDGAWGVYTMYNDGSNVQKLIDLGANAPNWQNDRMAWTP